jgi:hypothetical protein
MNTDGGVVTEGIAIFQRIQRSELDISIAVDGLAASMGAALLSIPEVKAYAYKYSKVMIHRVSGFVSGDPDDIEEELNQIRDFENDLINMFSEKTGMTEDDVRSKYFDGKNHWLSAKEAKKIGLLEDVLKARDSIKPPKNLHDSKEVFNYFQTQITNRHTNSNQNNVQMKNSQRFINLLNLSPEAEEDAIYNAAKQAVEAKNKLEKDNADLKAEKDKLQKQVDEAEKAKVKNLIDNAISEKKITEEERKHYEELANTNFELAKNHLDKLPAHKTIKSQLGGDAGDENSIYAKRSDWTFKDWQKKDGKGLQNMKNDNPELYKSLYKAEFGKEPQNL